jgi:hypothetical protein
MSKRIFFEPGLAGKRQFGAARTQAIVQGTYHGIGLQAMPKFFIFRILFLDESFLPFVCNLLDGFSCQYPEDREQRSEDR